MVENLSEALDAKLKEKDAIIEELENQLRETERKLNKLDGDLEKRIIERTVEVNKLLLHKTRFIDNLSHDLGTPLTPLITLLPAIKNEVSDPQTKELVDTCIRNAEYIRRVVNNTRKLAEISATDLLLKKENVFDIVNELQKKYEVIFNSCNIKVENNISNEVFIKTDKSKLMDLFDHVSSNAVNSMPNGGTLTFKSKTIQRDDETFIQISVSDTGVGLIREQTDHLFDEFYKVDDSRHKLDSTGLGLTICKNIVEKHGGKIWAESHGEGTGTTIHFTLPSPEVVFSRSF